MRKLHRSVLAGAAALAIAISGRAASAVFETWPQRQFSNAYFFGDSPARSRGTYGGARSLIKSGIRLGAGSPG
jgi:hypothetical protein